MSEAYREVFDRIDPHTGEVIKSSAPLQRRKSKPLPFAMKHWSVMTDSDKNAMREHMTTFEKPEDLLTYKKYLRDWCNFPLDWLGITERT